MFLERMMNQGTAPLLEQVVKFSSARHRLILDNIANVDTPNYRQKDLSVDKFQSMLSERIESQKNGESTSYDDIAVDVENPTAGILFHDGNNRSMEQMATDLAKNALIHNMAVELLRKQFAQMEMALKDRPG